MNRDVAPKVRPFFLESEMYKLSVSSNAFLQTQPVLGDSTDAKVSWTTGGSRMHQAIAVSVLGSTSEDDVFYAPPDLFLSSALRMGGEPIFSPPPFAAPCTDGLLIIYTLRRSLGDVHDVHGAYILVDRKTLESGDHPASLFWSRATKNSDAVTALKVMGFGETRPWMLN
jgi:hypothetical protein